MKVTRSISIEQKTLDKLQKLADEKFITVSAIIRQAIHEKIERESKQTEN